MFLLVLLHLFLKPSTSGLSGLSLHGSQPLLKTSLGSAGRPVPVTGAASGCCSLTQTL